MNQRQCRWNPNEATTGFFLIRFIGTWPSLRVEELPFNESEFQLIPWRISYPKGPKQRLMNGTANDGMAFLLWNFVLCINLTLNSCRFPLVGIHNNWLRVSLITCKVSCCIHLHQRDVKISLRWECGWLFRYLINVNLNLIPWKTKRKWEDYLLNLVDKQHGHSATQKLNLESEESVH